MISLPLGLAIGGLWLLFCLAVDNSIIYFQERKKLQ